MVIFTELEKIPKFHTEPLKTSNSQSNLAEENKAEGIMLPNFKIPCKATVN